MCICVSFSVLIEIFNLFVMFACKERVGSQWKKVMDEFHSDKT